MTTYSVSAVPVEGDVRETLFALYPHQWRHTSAAIRPESYGSVRGQMRLTSGTQFETRMQFPGVLPCLPDCGGCDRAKITAWLEQECSQPLPPIKDTYWEGKWLGQQATLLTLADQYQLTSVSHALRDRIASRLEYWFTANEPGKPIKQAGLFCYDDKWRTLIGYPASFGSDAELNDHHFHYGYFIRAAAEIAVRDPEWGDSSRWGGLVQWLIRDIASLDRDDSRFPFLRNFDPYAGHSWAAGHAKFGDGNNNESSSEAMNAWYGILLWGQATGDRTLRDLGIYLYTTEMSAIEEYWFDVHDENHPPAYTPSVVTMVWGGKGANGTWFSADPEMVHGINWLPIHGGSLYLGRFPDYVEKNYRALCTENGGTNWSAWSDLIWMYRALTNPEDARAQFDAGGEKLAYEAGNSAANTYHWIANLEQLGQVDRSVSADYPFAATFGQAGQRAHVAYNPERQTRTVRFSDGASITVAPNTIGVQR
jgi:endoglucanase Acf2